MARALSYLTERMRAHAWRGARPTSRSATSSMTSTGTRASRASTCFTTGTARPTPSRRTRSPWMRRIRVRPDRRAPRQPRRARFGAGLLLSLSRWRSWRCGPGTRASPAPNARSRARAAAGTCRDRTAAASALRDNAETLLLIATSHYEPNEHGYDLLLQRARALPDANRVAMALGHAQAMGGHLRFGFEVTYGKDLKAMRDDNGADYPWLCFALAGLMEEYARLSSAGGGGPRARPRRRRIDQRTDAGPGGLSRAARRSWLDRASGGLVRVRGGLRPASRGAARGVRAASPAGSRVLADRRCSSIFRRTCSRAPSSTRCCAAMRGPCR